MPRLTAIRKQAIDGMMKEALFGATVAVLNEHGVDGMTMDRVAMEAGVAKGSLYRYFGSKRDLLEFVYAKMVDPIFQDLDEIVASRQSALEKLQCQLHSLLEHVAKHAHVHRLLFENDAAHGILQPSERRCLEVASQRLAEIFRQGMAEGVFCPGDAHALASMYLGLCRGMLQTQPELTSREQREDIHCMILEAFLNGTAVEKVQIG